MATIKDVCKLAGVSKTTASRVINGSDKVKENTRLAVLKAMQELDYHPNIFARALASNTSDSIGLILPQFDSNYFGNSLRQAAQKVHAARKRLVIMDSNDSAAGEMEAIQTQIKQRCEAVIVYCRHLSEEQLIELQQNSDVPIIVLNRTLVQQKLFSFGFNQTQIADSAMQHLIDLGHKQIACITTPLNSDTGRKRLESYRKLLRTTEMPLSKELEAEGDTKMSSGYQATKQFLASGCPFTAIFAGNDNMALGALRALREAGIAVPEQVALVGIDNEPGACFAFPSLTTVTLPIEKMVADAVDLALLATKSAEMIPRQYIYTGELIVRESTGSGVRD